MTAGPSYEEHLTAKKESMERTSVLANERTYAAWIRTGLTSLATGLAVAKFLVGSLPPYHAEFIALILITFGGLCFALAAWRYDHVAQRLVSTHVSGAPRLFLVFLSSMLVLCVLLAIWGIFV
ncbi:MAG: DUF202 domain-containing protein [Chlamydiales bacterium]|nr:DUF202 domain-containing protein [Chlamydiia bacterium]MCP5508536.1 DUF202 domain-containing protein [Chlamydiales bacterium]